MEVEGSHKALHIDPKDVMKLSSPGACLIYLLAQFDGIDLPPSIAHTEEERLELNSRKPKYVSFTQTSKFDKNDKMLTRCGDFLLSMKVIEGDANALFLVHGNKVLQANDINNLGYPCMCEYQGTTPITVISEWIMFYIDSDEYKYSRGQSY